MTMQGRTGRRGLAAAALGLVLAVSGTAGAQTLSTPTVVDDSSPGELSPGSSSAPSYERETSAAIVGT